MRLRALARALLGVGMLAVVAAGPARGEDGFAAVLDRELAAIVDDPAYPLPSLSVLAIRDGQVVYERAFGLRHRAQGDGDRDLAATPATLYRIASVSKLVTTLVVMTLVEDGRVSLDADASDYLGWRLRNPHFPDAKITLRMLLSHTSSLRDGGGYFWPADKALRDALVPGGALYGEGGAWAKDHAPGTWFSYANLPWGVVGQVVEKVTGERFDRYAKRAVLEPLGVPGGYNPAALSAAELANLATLYRKREAEGAERWDTSGPWIAQVDDYARKAPVSRADERYAIGTNGTVMAPQGGLRTSAAGLGRIMRMLLDRGVLDGKRVFKATTIDAMLAETWRANGRNGDTGYGNHQDRFQAWGLGNQHFTDVGGPARGDRLVDGGGYKAFGHFGDAWGLNALFAFDPATRSGMIFLTGGAPSDPEKTIGRYSAMYPHEERIATALYRRAIQGRAD